MNIKIPIKHLIVNNDAQARLLFQDGTVYLDGEVTPVNGAGVILEGWLPLVLGSEFELLAAATRIRTDTPSAGAAGVIEVEVLVGSGANAYDTFMVRVGDSQKVPTEFQDYQPLEKRYQLSSAVAAGTDSEDAIATQIVDTINADPHAHVTAAIQAGGPGVQDGIVVLTAKEVGQTVEFYVSQENEASGLDVTNPATLTYEGAFWSVLTAAAHPVNNYEALKNIDWARDLDFDRNVEYQPEYGATYDSYYFEVNWTPKDVGGHGIPSIAAEQQAGRTGFKLWVKEGLTLNAAMDLLAGDLNV